MKKLKYYVASSLDGAIADSEGGFGFLLMEGEHLPDFIESFSWFDTVLMGRKTYEVGLAEGKSDPYPMFESYVFSRSMAESPNERVKLVSDKAAELVAGLKAGEGKDIWLCGGGQLATDLLEAGLVDEVIVKINPVLAGPGTNLFNGKAAIALELVDHKVYGNGVVLLSYRVPASGQ